MTVDAVCVGAHPDDVEIGMGGTVAGMVRRGLSVAIVDLTDGEPTPHGTHERRMAEAACAAAVLGAERVTLDLPNRYLFDSVEARTKLAEVLRELRPRMMFVPYPVDAHPDHVAAGAICEAARFYAKFTKTGMRGEPHYPARLYRYMAVHLRIAAEPSFLVDITQDLPKKTEALACYSSQFAENPDNAGVVPMVEGMAGMWGAIARTEAAEPFFAVEGLAVRAVEDLL
ncbi:MAG: bacillithiol biosynthesis deacetylase BshB1 [Coriobacteriaceae bacterium]|nr:bacillithiol biosynthesis deacetylase BshB1 [Coriobacteriaceae bacterium]